MQDRNDGALSSSPTECRWTERRANSLPGVTAESPSCGGQCANEAMWRRIVETLVPGGLLLSLGTAIAAASAVPSADRNPVGLIEAIAILTVIIGVHECGHFLAARLQNVHVNKFAIGFGPTLLKYQGAEVEYSLRAIPLGGFISFPEDDKSSTYPSDDPDLLQNRPIPERALIISAGVIANIVFAFTILFAQVSTVGVADRVYEPGVRIPMVMPHSVAESSGLKSDDIIISVDGIPVAAGSSAVSDLVHSINESPGQRLPFLVNRNGKTIPITVVPEEGADGKGRIGLQLVSNASVVWTKATNLFQAIVLASNEFQRMSSAVVQALHTIFSNFQQAGSELSGPLAVVAVGAEVAQVDSTQLFQYAAMININLAIVNILPMPALDGGFLALLLLEAVRGGKKLPQGVENGVTASGWLLLMVLGCILVVRDTVHLGILQSFL